MNVCYVIEGDLANGPKDRLVDFRSQSRQNGSVSCGRLRKCTPLVELNAHLFELRRQSIDIILGRTDNLNHTLGISVRIKDKRQRQIRLR